MMTITAEAQLLHVAGECQGPATASNVYIEVLYKFYNHTNILENSGILQLVTSSIRLRNQISNLFS